MLRALLISLVPVLSGCGLLQRMTAPPSSAPESDRSLWPEYCTEYRNTLIRIKVPASKRYPEIRDFAAQVPDRPPLADGGIGQVLAADFDVDTGLGYPEFGVGVVLYALPPGTQSGHELAALQADLLNRAPQDCPLSFGRVAGNGLTGLHATQTHSAHGYLIKDIYLCLVPPDRYLLIAGAYGPMTLNPEWLASRRKVIEDIFRSVRIGKKGP